MMLLTWVLVCVLVAVGLAISALAVLVLRPGYPAPKQSHLKHQARVVVNRKTGESDIFRAPELAADDALLSNYWEDVSTMYDTFQRGLQLYPNNACLGWRVGNGPYVWQTYAEVWKRIETFGRGLVEKGAQPGEFVALYSTNCAEWVIASEACNAFGFVSVPLYDTLGHEAVQFILNQTKTRFMVAAASKLVSLQNLREECPGVEHVILMDSSVPAVSSDFDICSFAQVEALGLQSEAAVRPPKPSDLFTICYTSGTTGDPKGVELTHGAFVAAVSGITKRIERLGISQEDVHISYLPLAHVFERVVQGMIFPMGASVGFFRGEISKLFEDILELRPTFFPSVPRLYARLYDKVWAKINAAGGLSKLLFEFALSAKKANLKRGIYKHKLWDNIVFDKIRARLGGRVRFMISGAAPLAPEVMEFLRCCFAVDVLEGYGQTETAAGAAVSLPGDAALGSVGPPVPCCEMKLVDVPEMNYYSSDMPHARGEICFRGPNLFRGYYKMPEKTAETIDKDGWLHTGDVGQMLANGTLQIIDRKKNIFKLSQGEYVAPEKIENVYLQSPFVGQVFVHGDSLEAYLVAVVVPDADTSLLYARDHGIEARSIEDLCENAGFKTIVMQSMREAGKRAKLRGFEHIRALYLHHEEFSVQNNLLTPTFKLKRPQAAKIFQLQIERMYEEIRGERR